MQQADDVSSYAREDRPRIHGVQSSMIYSSLIGFGVDTKPCVFIIAAAVAFSALLGFLGFSINYTRV